MYKTFLTAFAITSIFSVQAATAQTTQYYKYDSLGRVLLSASTNGTLDGFDYDNAGNRVMTNRVSLHLPATSDRLIAGDGLPILGIITSPNGTYKLSMQADGNLFVYTSSAGVWASNTPNSRSAYALMDYDGCLKIFSLSQAVIWTSPACGGTGAYAVLQNDGKLVIKTSAGATAWAT